MNSLRSLCRQVAATTDYRIVLSDPASDAALEACANAIGSALPRSLADCLRLSDGFELHDPDVSIMRVYSASEIAASTIAIRKFWLYPDGISPWGDFIEIARSDHTESTYAIRPLAEGNSETPLHEMWSEGYDTWLTDPPLAPTFGHWLTVIAAAIATGDPQRVYDTLWLGPARRNSN